MKDKLGPDLLEEARQLLERGKVQESLVLAMSILCRELDQLRIALEAIQDNLPASRDEAAAAARADCPRSEFFGPEPPSRLLH